MEKSHNPLVSVVMPSYNSEAFIKESIESVINQTFKDWELLIVDGHSKDATQKIIQSYAETDGRIKLLSDEGKGIGPALHQGCLAARGRYIARLDSDDIAYPNRFEVQVKYLNTHPETDLISCFSEYINNEGKSLGYKFQYSSRFVIKKDPSNIFHPGVMMRKKAYMKSGGYPPLKRAEDLFLWHRLLRCSDVKILEQPLVKYRLSEDSLSSSMSSYFRDNVNALWSVIAKKEVLTQSDFDYLNTFINDNITHDSPVANPVRKSEMLFVNTLRLLVPRLWAYKIFFVFKNLFGIFRFGINY